MDILEEVKARYEDLSSVQKRIADYIFKYPDEVCFCSLKTFAGSLGVTEVTILRFVKKLGLSGFVELKECLREHIQNRLSHGDALGRVSDRIGRDQELDQDKDEMLREFVENEINTLRETYGRISAAEIMEAVALIKNAKTVYTMGGDLLKPVCSYLTRRLLGIGIPVVDMGVLSHANFQAFLSGITPGDVVVIFTLPGYDRQIMNASGYLGRKRIPMVVVTDKENSLIAQQATTVLPCGNHDLFFYNSPLGVFSVASLLAYFTAMDDPEETNKRRGRISEAREALYTAEL